MGIKVLFIYPNLFGMNMLPPALAIFSALLKREGHSIDIFDSTYYDMDYGAKASEVRVERLNIQPYDMGERGIRMRKADWRVDIKAKVKDFDPDLIAMSTTEDMWELGVMLLEGIEDHIVKTQTPVVVGGVFATFAPHLAIDHHLVKAVCVGEGENTIVDLCDCIQRGVPFDNVTNLWVKGKDGIITKNLISRPVDINATPLLDIELFEEERIYRPMAGKVYRMLPVETMRGCPYKCAYCNSPSQMSFYKNVADSNFFRKKRADLVHKELRYFVDEFKAEYFYFWADTFLAQNRKEFDEFCEIYSDIRKPFWIQTRPETLTDYHIGKLVEIGLHRMSFGVEHGNEAFRAKYLDRQLKNEMIIEKLKIPHKFNVPFSVNNITGFPFETRELAMDTVELNRHIDSNNQNIYSFEPFHGTPLRKLCEDHGFVQPGSIAKCLTSKSILNLPQYPQEEIEGLKKCFTLYVKLPKNRWKDIRKAEADTPEGDRIFEELKQEYLDKYYVEPEDNPHAEVPNVADLEYGVARP